MQRERSQELHVAIIMDGNGRWASYRGLPRIAGHRAGVAAVRRVVERASALGIRSGVSCRHCSTASAPLRANQAN